jgi:hypothetical protein
MRLILLGLVALGMGVALLLWSADRTRAARASVTWPSAEGVVVRSEVVRSGGGSSRSSVSYEADVRYRYAVGGRRYESGRFAIGVAHSFADPAAARAEVAAYPPGRRVRVYYDPREPAESCLVPGVDGALRTAAAWIWILPALGVGLTAAGARSVRRRGGVRAVADAAFGTAPLGRDR